MNNYNYPGNVLCLDFETSGVVSEYDHITRIGAAVMQDGDVCATFDTRLQLPASAKISLAALACNIGKFSGQPDEWKNVGKGLKTMFEAPDKRVAAQEFGIWLADNGGFDLPVIAYKASFDHAFFDKSLASFTTIFRPMHPVWIDVLALAKRVLNGKLKSYTLDSVLDVLGLPSRSQSAHDPAEDAVLCGKVYFNLLQRITTH